MRFDEKARMNDPAFASIADFFIPVSNGAMFSQVNYSDFQNSGLLAILP